jgi:hypothetical protein
LKGYDEKPWPMGPFLAIIPFLAFIIPVCVGIYILLHDIGLVTVIAYVFWWPVGIETISIEFFNFSFDEHYRLTGQENPFAWELLLIELGIVSFGFVVFLLAKSDADVLAEKMEAERWERNKKLKSEKGEEKKPFLKQLGEIFSLFLTVLVFIFFIYFVYLS